MRSKDEVLRILNAFMQAGVDLDKENVLSKMTHRGLYMLPEEGRGGVGGTGQNTLEEPLL